MVGRAVVDVDSGQVVQRLAYDAYGGVTQDTAPGTQPFGYKGALSDPVAEGAGLIWMGVRAYLPAIGRFTTVDPAGLAAGWNQHDALGGDPINLVDVDGRIPVPVLLFGARVVGQWAFRRLAASATARAVAALAAEEAALFALNRMLCAVGEDPVEPFPPSGDEDGDGPTGVPPTHWPVDPTELERHFGPPKRIPDTPETPGRDKREWNLPDGTRIVSESHPYDSDTHGPSHTGPHYHIDLPGRKPHSKRMPGQRYPR